MHYEGANAERKSIGEANFQNEFSELVLVKDIGIEALTYGAN